MIDDPYGVDNPDDQMFTLIVKADSDEKALAALDERVDLRKRVIEIRRPSLGVERVMVVEFDIDPEEHINEWGRFRTPAVNQLNLWMARDLGLEAPYPEGSLLYWRPGGFDEPGPGDET